MQTSEFEQLQKEEKGRARKKASDRFWRSFLFTDKGQIKSTLLINSFCLSIVLLAVYLAAFSFLVDPLHALVGGGPVVLVNLVEALVPTLAGAALCSLSWFISKEKRLLPAAYLWLALLAVACSITMLVILWGDTVSQQLFWRFFALFVPAPILLGGGSALFLYCRYRKKRRPAIRADTLKGL